MFGSLRFILAVLVLTSHLNGGAAYNFGISAVIGFFMISGYVMTYLIHRNYNVIGKRTWWFYIDRFLRIYPQYIFFVLLTLICNISFGLKFASFTDDLNIWGIILNLLIVPTNYYLFVPSLNNFLIIPPAWTLGLEEQFYWAFPFLALKKSWGIIATFASLILFCLPAFKIIPYEYSPYMFLPCTLFIFMMGKNLAEYNISKNKNALRTLVFLYASSLIICFIFWNDVIFTTIFREILGGIIFGFPLIAFLSRLPRKKWDDFIGNASYGIFLSHSLVINLFIHFQVELPNMIMANIIFIGGSVVAGYTGYFLVEKPINKFRRKLRA